MTTNNTLSRRIVVGVDPSANAARAAEWAAREATDRGAPLHLVHALNQPHGTSLVDPAGSVRTMHETAAGLLDQVAGSLRTP